MARHVDADVKHTVDSSSMPQAFPFFLPYIVPLVAVMAHFSPHHWHSLLPPLFVWVLVPIIDVFVSKNSASYRSRLSRAQIQRLESQLSFRLAVYCWCPVQLSMLVWTAHRITQGYDPVHGIRLLGLVWSTALVSAEGINCSHELLHRRSALERFLGKLLLTSVLYGHFTIEHARGHHAKVATPEDPATMRFGESIYDFLPRTVLGGYGSAWRLEKARLARNGLAVFSIHNEMILYTLGQIAFCVSFYSLYGTKGLLLFFFQAAVAILLVEQINAIEHYGLLRKKLPSGEYEQVGPQHSWDAPHRVSSYLLFKLQVHADHHLHVSRRYQTLELTPGSPLLPAGYLTLMPILMVPPLWRLVMDPVLLSYRKRWDAEEARNREAEEATH